MEDEQKIKIEIEQDVKATNKFLNTEKTMLRIALKNNFSKMPALIFVERSKNHALEFLNEICEGAAYEKGETFINNASNEFISLINSTTFEKENFMQIIEDCNNKIDLFGAGICSAILEKEMMAMKQIENKNNKLKK